MSGIQRVSPPYVQVVEWITEQIVNGSLSPGDRIQSESELREAWGISKATANKIVARLKADGLIETRPGFGAVVRDQSQHRGVGPRDMWARIKARGRIRSDSEWSQRTIDWCNAADAPSHVVAALNATPASGRLLRRSRVIHQGDVPVSMAISWFHPAMLTMARSDVVSRLSRDDPIPEGTPQYIAEELERDLDTGVDHVAATSATESVSEKLGVPVGSPILRIVSTIYAGDFPVEVGEYLYPSDVGIPYEYSV